jgi:hypothetical protein
MRLHLQRHVNQFKIGGVLDTAHCLCFHPLAAGWLCCARDAERDAIQTDLRGLASCRHRAPTKIDVLRPLVPVFIQHRPTDTKYHEDRCRFSTVKSSPKMANNRQYDTSSGWQQDVPIHHQQDDEANRQYYPPSPWQQEIAVPSYNEDDGYRQGESSRGYQGKLIFAFIIPSSSSKRRNEDNSLNMQFR